jgi:hypothetical protein
MGRFSGPPDKPSQRHPIYEPTTRSVTSVPSSSERAEYPRRCKARAARLAMGIGYVVGVIGGGILAHAAYATIQCK